MKLFFIEVAFSQYYMECCMIASSMQMDKKQKKRSMKEAKKNMGKGVVNIILNKKVFK